MRLSTFELDGTTYYLLLNGAALFDIYDQFGQEVSVFDPIKGSTRDSFEAVCWYLETLATQGELYRRREGHDKGPIPTADMLAVRLSPLDVPRAKGAIRRAICDGFALEETAQPREIDKGLLELEKKTGGS